MSSSLDRLQEDLETHFVQLARQRQDSGFPLFILEHGLGEEDRTQLAEELRALVHDEEARSRYWLLWAVYATEQGYAYEGDEYWRSFEACTPGWGFSDRSSILRCFREFQRRYQGVVPSGPWANHFKIIAWPITHAILPRYLQLHFAKALYDLRFPLLGLDRPTPERIGHLLAGNAYSSSTRFEQFLQQEELCGRIVLALFHREPEAGREPIYPATLSRIVTDLERVRRAREWLKEAHHVVKDAFKGVGRGLRPHRRPRPAVTRSSEDEGISRPEIRPKLLLRYKGENRWSVTVELPSLRGLGALNEEAREFLRKTRCRISGAEDWKPSGWATSGRRKSIVRSWPEPGRALLVFEQHNALIEQILETDCKMGAGPIWLFKVGRDGTAREVIHKLVRPGNSYIVASKEDANLNLSGAESCAVECDGISCVHLTVPDNITEELRNELQDVGLDVARTIRVWPAGLPARGWDGEGSSEWLTTETPCFGIVNDYPVSKYVIYLNDGEGSEISAKSAGDPAFFTLPQLIPGTHYLTIEIKGDDERHEAEESTLPEGELTLCVRDPEPWRPGATLQSALMVTTDPYDTYLEAFWENKVSVSIVGPASHHVTCAIDLRDHQGKLIDSEQIDGPMNLPVSSEKWSEAFREVVSREQIAWAYLEAASCSLRVNGGELGECTLEFERQPRPVRWVPSRKNSGVRLRLVNDTGDEESRTQCDVYCMERPTKARQCDAAVLRSGVDIFEPGALFVAHHGEFRDSVVISTGLAGEGLQGLNVLPDVCDIRDGSVALPQAFGVLTLWAYAWLAGFLAEIRRKKVVESLENGIWENLCGSEWIRREQRFRDTPADHRTTRALLRGVGPRSNRFVTAVRSVGWDRLGTVTEASEYYARMAMKYRICNDQKCSQCAFIIAFEPHHVYEMYGEKLEEILEKLRLDPRILRVARLTVLMSQEHETAGE